jgi:hypothetical protein
VQTPDDIWERSGLAERRLAGLAVNPSAPPDVLLRLLADGPLPARMVLCRDRVLTDELVDVVVAHPDPMTRSFLARNPHTDPAHRARLVDDQDWFVRTHVVGGPRPGDTPLLPLPDEAVVRILTTYGSAELVEIEVLRQISVEMRKVMPDHPQAKVRRLLPAPWQAWPAETREALLNDPDEKVRALAQSCLRHEDPDWVERELPDKACHARTMLLIQFALSRNVVERIIDDEEGAEERGMIAMNPHLPADAVVRLAADPDPTVREEIARRADLGPAELRALAVDPDPEVRLAASVHPALSEDERDAIDYEVPMDACFGHEPEPVFPRDLDAVRRDAVSRHPMLRRAAARDHRLPADLVERLAADDDLGVRVLLAQNPPDAPPALLLRSFLEYTGRERGRLAARPGFPTAGLARFADHQDPQVRALAARDPETGAATVDRLIRDADAAVRAAAAGHPSLPPQRLTELLDDEELAHRAAANPALPARTIESLIASGGQRHS